jgi:origin recognition complex subunit 4
VNGSPSKTRSIGRLGSTNSAQTSEDEDEESEGDELAADTPSATPSKQVAGKRLWGSTAASPTPKGILTPSKNRTQTPKTVKFDKRLNGELHFEDLPKTKKTTTPRKPPKEKQPEIVCGICSAPHSKPPNQIILCDNCDYAVHQQCYGMTEIPEGDWLCKSCSQEDIFTSTPKKDTTSMSKAPSRPDDIPDIPNLDRHVRSLQRVLLDRCAGRRRIDMFGLQEVKDKARQIIEQTVVAGEGNSMLLIGARGSGKTTVSATRFEDAP